MLFVSWLSAPWRLARSLLTGLASTLAGRRPRRGVAVVVVTGLAVAATRAAQQGQWMVGGALVLIGSGHSSRTVNYVERQGDFQRGTLTVTKGGPFSKGGVQVTGVSAAQRGLVEEVIKLFSKKEVTFA